MIARYIGMDIHKNYAVIAAVNVEQAIVMNPLRIEMAYLEDWIASHITSADRVILEATTNAWAIVDLLRNQTTEVVVANPYKTKLIAEAHIKNDKVDALALAKLLAARFVCEVWVPDHQVREQRALAAHRTKLQQQCTGCKNRLHGVLRRHNLRYPGNSLFTVAGYAWLDALELPVADIMQVRHLHAQLTFLQDQLNEVEWLIARQATRDPRIPRLMQMTGIGFYTAFAILAWIGTIQRFPSADKLSAYAGLVPRQYQSGNRSYHGPITKAGNSMLRWLLVEAAKSAVRFDPHWKQVHARLAQRRGASIATVAVARKLLVTIWHLLHDHTNYFYLRPQTFVTKLQRWAFCIGREHLPASCSKEFVINHLTALNLDDLVSSLSHHPKNSRLLVSVT